MADYPENQNKLLPATELVEHAIEDDPLIGIELDGRYRIVEEIGVGGWGSVYRAKHLGLDRDFAIKIVHKHHLRDELNVMRFEQETKLLSRFRNKHVVEIVDHGLKPAPYIVMEYCDGVSLKQWLKDNGPMSPEMAIELFLQLCDGLVAAEAIHIVHRDLKPSNILIKINDNMPECKILDFGLAKMMDQSSDAEKLTATGDILGSPAYMPPEQWSGRCDHRTDIYSLGCIIYEVLTGKQAFFAEQSIAYMNKHCTEIPQSISLANPAQMLPAALEDIVSKCMQKLPANRYQTAKDCSADLKKIKLGLKPQVILPEKLKPSPKKLIFLCAGLSILAVAALYMLRQPTIGNISRPESAIDAPFQHDKQLSQNSELSSKDDRNAFLPAPPPRPDIWHNKTIAEWSEAIEKNPADFTLFYDRAILHIMRQEFSQAAEDLSKAIQINPQFAEAYAERSIVNLRLNGIANNYEKILGDANTAIRLKPSLAHGYYARACVFECTEQHKPAIIDCRKAIDLGESYSEFEPPYGNVYETLSTAYTNMGQYDDAFKAVEAGLKVVSQRYRTLLFQQRAMVHYMKQEFSSAISDCKLAIKESELPQPPIWLLMACCYNCLGQRKQAEATYRDGQPPPLPVPLPPQIETGPSTMDRRQAEYWSTAGVLDKAIQNCSSAIEDENSKYYYSLRLRSLYYIRQGKLKEALVDLKAAANLAPFSAKTLSWLAMVENKNGEKFEAQKEIANSFSLPTHPPIAFVNRASIEFDAGKLKEALADLNEAVSLDPCLKEAFELRKDVNSKLGHKKEADHDSLLAKQLATHLEFFP